MVVGAEIEAHKQKELYKFFVGFHEIRPGLSVNSPSWGYNYLPVFADHWTFCFYNITYNLAKGEQRTKSHCLKPSPSPNVNGGPGRP